MSHSLFICFSLPNESDNIAKKSKTRNRKKTNKPSSPNNSTMCVQNSKRNSVQIRDVTLAIYESPCIFFVCFFCLPKTLRFVARCKMHACLLVHCFPAQKRTAAAAPYAEWIIAHHQLVEECVPSDKDTAFAISKKNVTPAIGHNPCGGAP